MPRLEYMLQYCFPAILFLIATSLGWRYNQVQVGFREPIITEVPQKSSQVTVFPTTEKDTSSSRELFPCSRQYSEPLISFVHPCDWEILHPGISYDKESLLHITRDGQQIASIKLYPKNHRFYVGSGQSRALSLLEFMDFMGYVKSGVLFEVCIKKEYGSLLGYECSITPYKSPSFIFMSKYNGAFLILSQDGHKQYSNEFRKLIASIRL